MNNKISFAKPYTLHNKLLRLLWSIVWFIFAKPFPRNTAMSWKRLLLRLFKAKIADTATIYSSVKIFMPWHLTMEDYSCLGPGVDCYNAAPIFIGKYATVSQRSYLCTASHNINSVFHEQIEKPIYIGDKSWIAAEAFIGPGVKVGVGAVVGARGCVYKDVDSWNVVGGNPAQFIKKRVIK